MSGNYSRERAPPSSPAVGQLRCQQCKSAISRAAYERFGMFCKEKHKNEWSVVILTPPYLSVAATKCNAHLPIRYAKQSQNRR